MDLQENLAALRLPIPPAPRARVPRPPPVLVSPMPRVEPLTPDRAPVPFYSPDDVKELALPGLPVMEHGVVDEYSADCAFAAARRSSDAMLHVALRSPSDLAPGSFPGSSNLPTPGLSQKHINQLAQRPTPPPMLPPTPPLDMASVVTVAEDRLPSMLAVAPPPASWPTNSWSVSAATRGMAMTGEESGSSSGSKSGGGGGRVRKRKMGAAEQPQCEICHSKFARRSNLYKHVRSVHSATRQYKCDICNYAFKRQDHLLKHKRGVHTKERKYACEICGTAFAEKYNKQKHMRVIHETKRPFRCGCGAYFQHRDQMLQCLRCKTL